ncbi:kinase-like domain-containing protein [Globomyces pollinis-pini]|nr:kinase-like domain-containing protein [Globomyces pollinis-pini]
MTEVVFEPAGRRSVPNPVETVNSQAATHAPTTPRTTSTGQRVGPYILGKTLGVGSTGRVKLAVHMETNHKVAIKIINKDSGEVDPKKMAAELKKLEREITIMKLIQHPNILQIYDVYETSKELYLVLEHVEGGELFDYLVKKGRLPESESLAFFQQIVYGVEFCHRHMICHRDLKPENLLLDKDHNVKVADFGMANMQIQKTKMLETSCGSPHYASPEIIRGDKYNGPTSDVWSCGIILYALVTGNLPFDDNNIRRLLNKVKTGVYQIPDYVPDGPRDLIKRMLTVDPNHRITLSEVLRNEWFLSREPKIPIPNITSAVEESVQDYDQNYKFEEDLMASLALLGCTDRAELHKALLAPG